MRWPPISQTLDIYAPNGVHVCVSKVDDGSSLGWSRCSSTPADEGHAAGPVWTTEAPPQKHET